MDTLRRGPRGAFAAALWMLLPALGSALPCAAQDTEVARAPRPIFELVETWPLETELDHPELRDTHDVWLEMIARAERSIDLAQFYASSAPGSRLEAVIAALEAAAARGVAVRFLASETFRPTYPETLERLGAHDGIEVRTYDIGAHPGGVLHAKYWVVDGREVFLGSQNFDFRALEHIVELGARFEHPELARPFVELFEADWRLAGGETDVFEERAARPPGPVVLAGAYGEVRLTPVFSPPALLAHEDAWDLPRLVERIDSARRRVRVQVLTYSTTDREGRYFADLEQALRRAAARGVKVELMAADWSKRRFVIEGLQSLQCLPNVEVRLVTIPEHSDGFVPFARVIHAKTLAVDGERGWIGTGNWNRGTFHESRNVGLLVEGAATVAVLERFFETTWSSSHAYPVDPAARYEAPRTDH